MSRPEPKAWLAIAEHGKGIPYHGIAEYETGSTHFGFKPLKGRPEETDAIHEVQDDPALRDTLLAFNDESTGVFTVGCEKSFNYEQENGHWAKGYIEFAINDKGLVGDAQNYFHIFFRFSQFIRQQKFSEPVIFRWELEGAEFTDANVGGFTAAVWVTVFPQATAEKVREIWAKALSILTAVICGMRPRADAEYIYSPPASV